jgi:serine phosphatase RsbU (regulator of sigma subunit)
MASFALLDALVSDAPVGLAFWDTEIRCLRVNGWLAAMAGVPAAEHAGRTPRETLGPLGERLETCAREVLSSGEPVGEVELTGEVPTSPGGPRHWRVSFYAVDGPDLTPIGVGATVVDITNEREAVERQRRQSEQERREHAESDAARAEVLARASAALSSSLQPETVLNALVEAMVPELADWCTIHTAEPNGALELRAVAHSDPERSRLVWQLADRYPPSTDAPAGAGAVIRSGRPEIHHELADELLAAVSADGEDAITLRDLAPGSAVVLPLRVQRRVLGALTLVMAESGRHYRGRTLELAESVAAQAAVALDNARLYAEQAATAKALQRGLRPPELPEITGIDLAVCYRPAGRALEVGGDFYDVFSVAEDRWNLLIGDVVGKGADAAALTGLVRYTLRAAALGDPPLGEQLGAVNHALLHRTRLVEFCSAIYASLTAAAGEARVTLATCGHPPALVLRADGRVEELAVGGPLLGVTEAAAFVEDEVVLTRGETLLLYTDGVIELPGRNPWRGMDLLQDTLRRTHHATAAQIVDRVQRATLLASAGTPRDDLALLAIRVPDTASGEA